MTLINNKIESFFGPVFTYAGYVFMAAGIITLSYSYNAAVLVVAGAFIAFTYTGTIIDTENKKVRPYTALFGLYKLGKWTMIDNSFSLKIIRVNRRYSTYSRTNMRNDLYTSDIRLLIIKKATKTKITLNKYPTYKDARRDSEELSGILMISDEDSRHQ